MYESARVAITSHFIAGWNATTYPVVFDNQPWTTAGGQPTTKTWCRFSIHPASKVTPDTGGDKRRVRGFAWLQIFIPEEKGTRDATLIGDIFEGLFSEKHLVTGDGLIRFDCAALSYVAKEANGWEQWKCVVDYMEDDIL